MVCEGIYRLLWFKLPIPQYVSTDMNKQHLIIL